MSNSRFQYAYRDNASKLHKIVGDILRDGSFGEHEIYQEYPVNRVNEYYPDGSHHFDWVVPDLKLVFECHGRQHYEVTDWEGNNPEKAIEDFKAMKERDFAKREAAWTADWIYVEVPYHMEKKLTAPVLLELVNKARTSYQDFQTTHKEELARNKEEQRRSAVEKRSARAKEIHAQQKEKLKELRAQYLESDKHKETLERARLLRREQYQRMKGK